MEENIVKGDIFVEIKGYSMYIAHFYKVVQVTNKSVKLQECKKRTIGGGDFNPQVVPDKDALIGEVFIKRRTSYIGHLWDGKPITEDWLD